MKRLMRRHLEIRIILRRAKRPNEADGVGKFTARN